MPGTIGRRLLQAPSAVNVALPGNPLASNPNNLNTDVCYCDATCMSHNDCCADYEAVLRTSSSTQITWHSVYQRDVCTQVCAHYADEVDADSGIIFHGKYMTQQTPYSTWQHARNVWSA